MATTYNTATAPQLESLSCVRVEGGKSPAGAPTVASAGYQWVRTEYVLTLFRIDEGLSSFLPVAGQTYTGNQLGWTGGETSLIGSADQTYKCLSHELVPEFAGSSIYRERTVYKWESKWEQAAASEVPKDNQELGPETDAPAP